MMTATISPTERSVKATSAKQITAVEYPNEIEIPTHMVFLETFSLHYGNAETNRRVLLTPVRRTVRLATESAGARSGYYVS